ncbi:dipeptide epimerase [Sphingomonas alpina]|uniref:Dipeptide epimerase n=1 Tax=Sphingomonas alpina TaxID=653931 RepID=A0A7H0LIS7_9SPHN|nr:dipeptide epimerase [Sphingomonas alpina]QNQ09580.1 dipeptide epimerase [Sphingomonas alpina]
MQVKLSIEPWQTVHPFRISGLEITAIDFLVVELSRDGRTGRGEAAGVGYRNDLPPTMIPQIEAILPALERGMDREELNILLPACGARNALDCAMWELEARLAGRPVWSLAGLEPPRPVETVFTIGVDTPETMALRATELSQARRLKLKFSGDGGDAERLRAVRAARPEVWLGVDANRGLTVASCTELVPVLVECGVALLEQPLALGQEAQMALLDLPIPVAADESVQEIVDLERLVGLFDIINIKLDKCGGLTHALAMERAARALGFQVMIGNMLGTSWSHAPAWLVAQRCDHVDLDGPTLLRGDREPALFYSDGKVHCPDQVWGSG